MNLPLPLCTIDNGHSHPHAAIFQDEKNKQILPLEFFFRKHQLDQYHFVISNVGHFPLPLEKYKNKIINLHQHFTDSSFLDMPVHYEQTLGDDRLFQAYALYREFFGDQIRTLLIDAGTFTTIDLIDQRGFLGGYI